MNNSKNTDMILIDGAYHEAGHVVMAYDLNWWCEFVEIEGVGAGQQDYSALTCADFDQTSWRRLLINLAGNLSGRKQRGQKPSKDKDELLYLIDAVKNGNIMEDAETYEDNEILTDDGNSIKILIEESPSASDEIILKKYFDIQNECWEYLNETKIWDSIEKVAQQLLVDGKIVRKDIEKLITI